jgi:hypothetical protein
LKIRSVVPNNRTRSFDVVVGASQYSYPYAKADPAPTREDTVKSVEIDRELARHVFNYCLTSGKDGWVHAEMVLEYNRDPAFLRDNLLYNLTVKARDAIETSPLSKREIIRRLRTSPSQLYRLLDQTNYSKSIDQMIALLQVLDRTVQLNVS